MKLVRVPRYIDAPMQIAFWEFDEIAPMVLLMAFGIMTGTLTYMFILMFVVTKWYQKYKSTARRGAKYKSTARRGALLHWMWWHGMYDVGGRFKNGLARRYVG